MLPAPDLLNDFEHGKFVLSNLAAKRAKQLQDGAPPLVQIESHHPLTIALAEIAAGKIKPRMLTEEEAAAIAEGHDITLLSDEPLPAELGMLLPGLDDTETTLVGSAAVLSDEETETEVEAAEDMDEMDLSDLVGGDEEEEEEETAEAEDDETVSLTDLAEEEASDEEEEE
jgi:DNA-directed RNA polymerase subunit omega